MKKRTKRAVTTTIAALVLVAMGTLAYLADVASVERNAFDSEVDMHVEVLETSGNAYNIEPGMKDPKDPTITETKDRTPKVMNLAHIRWRMGILSPELAPSSSWELSNDNMK